MGVERVGQSGHYSGTWGGDLEFRWGGVQGGGH